MDSDGEKVGGLYLELMLDVSGLQSGFAAANTIIARENERLQRQFAEMREESFRWLKMFDSGMSSAGHWSAEDLRRQDAEQRRRQAENPIELDKDGQEELERRLRDVERRTRRALADERDANYEQYKRNHTAGESELFRLQQMRNAKFDELNARYEKLQSELDATVNEQLRNAIQAQMNAVEAEQLAVDEKFQAQRDKIYAEAAQKAKDYYREAADIRFNASHTALEKELRDIDRWLEAQAKVIQSEEERTAAAEAASARRQAALQKETDLVREINQSIEDKIFAQEHSQYEQDVRKLQQEVVRQAQEYQKHGAFNDEARAKLDRYYQNALGKLNQRARESQAKGDDYTTRPRTGAPVEIIDFTKPQQPDIGLFASENTARQQVTQNLSKENQALVNGEKATNLAADAQKNFAQTATEAAQSFQKIDGDEIADAIHEAAHKIEIIEGDQIVGSETAGTGGALSLNELLANNLQQFTESLPAEEMQALTTQTQGVTTAEKDLQESTKSLTQTQAEGAKTFSDAIEKLKKVSFDDIGKSSGNRPKDTDVPTKATKSAPRDDEQPQREKVHLQTRPKDTSYKLEDLGLDYDTVKDVFLTGADMAATTASTGVGIAFSPETLATAIVAALGAGAIRGTYNNREERLNTQDKFAQKSLSTDAGEFADLDLSELATPLSSLDENVQGIRSILQGKDATADANAEGLESTAENSSFAELLTPLNGSDESVQSIWQRLQSERGNDNLADPSAEISQEAASKFGESLAAPIRNLVQELQTQQMTPELETQAAVTPQENLREIFAPVIANVNTPLADLLAAINNKKN